MNDRVIIIASHIAADIEQVCVRALLLEDGRTLAEEPLSPDHMVALVEFGRPPPDAQLLAIDGVEQVQALAQDDPGHQRLLHLASRPSHAWAETFAGRDWELRRFEPRRSLLSGNFGTGVRP